MAFLKDLEILYNLVQELNKSNSSLTKKEVYKNFPNVKRANVLIGYAYEPDITFGVTSKNLIKFSKTKKYAEHAKHACNKKYSGYKLLNELSDRVLTGHDALTCTLLFVDTLKPEFVDLFYKIIDKDLKIGMGVKTFNTVFPGTIKEFNVALAKKYTDKDFDTTGDAKWVISRKMDGVRLLMFLDKEEQKVSLYSRQGKELPQMTAVINSINFSKVPYSGFLDGELVYIDEDGKESFKGIMEKMKRLKDGVATIKDPNIRYAVFDFIPEEDFYNGTSETTLEDRLKVLDKIIDGKKNIYILEQVPYTEKNLEKQKKLVVEKGWEGLMLRRLDAPYKGKRSKDILKVKTFEDDEFKVLDIITGNFPVLDKKTKKMVDEEMMTAVVIDYNNTRVGSGFSIEERRKFYKNPKLIVGKVITVQYFEKTKDSLRFPTFKGIHGDKRSL